MKRFSYALTLVLCAIFFLFLGCEKVIPNEPQEPVYPGLEMFSLTATYGGMDTKAAFDEDGLNLSWQPGDSLFLIDVAGTNPTVVMKSSITEPSKTATFTSATKVMSGEYVVVYGQDNLEVKNSINMTSIADLNEQIRLYGSLSVEAGQTSASISMYQLFAMLTFKFQNLPNLTDLMLGVAAVEKGVPCLHLGYITKDGYIRSFYDEDGYEQLEYFYWNNGEEGKSLIPPVDFSGNTLYFFVYGTASDGKHVTYEFVKEGKKLNAGVNYNLVFDFANASSVCTLEQSSLQSGAFVLTTPEQFRAASYWYDGIKFSIEADVDFVGEVYFPITVEKLSDKSTTNNTGALYGNNHTLSNIRVDLSRCSPVGVVSTGWTSNITVKNSTFIGRSGVGAISGSCMSPIDISNCIADGVVVQGIGSVGGLFGSISSKPSEYGKSLSLSNCSLTGTSTVTASGGFSYGEGVVITVLEGFVGGIVGSIDSYCSISKCLVDGKISITTGGTKAGGIAGSMRSGISNSIVKGSVSISGAEYTGGIVGYSLAGVSRCGFEGEVNGVKYCGGIVGKADDWVTESYVLGNVNGTDSYIGGVSGQGYCKDSYHIGNTTGGVYTGGVSGIDSTTQNCYSYGTTSSGFGISSDLTAFFAGMNLTSSPYMAEGVSSDNCNCGPDKTFLSRILVINGNEAYSTQVWEGIDAQCPLLKWQSDALDVKLEIPGFGNEDW